MAYRSGRSCLSGLRLIGLLISCLGLCANTLWAQTAEIVFESPTNWDLNRICGFQEHPQVKLFVKDATDTCIWDIPGTIATSYEVSWKDGNIKGDTVNFICVSEPQSGTISVQVGKNGSVKATGSLSLTFVPKAAVPQNLVLDYPICQNIPVHMSIDVDEGYSTKYEPGSLHLSWQHKPKDGDFAEVPIGGVDVVSDADFKFTYTYSLKAYRDGEVQVKPFTCDATSYQTAAVSAKLTPFIVRNLYDGDNDPSEKEIRPLKYEKPDPGAEEADPWQTGDTENDKTICRFYGTNWNETNRVPVPEQWRQPGMGDGYLYLQFGRYYDFNTLEEPETYPEYYYRYEWTFNNGEDGKPKELSWADEEMERFKGNGFGREKNRVILQVHEGDGYNNHYTVNVKVYCDSCIARGGREEDFTYTASMTFDRLDSIQDFKDPDYLQYQVSYEVETQGRVCAGQETELKITYEDEASEKNFNNTNATLYYLQVPATWEESNGSAPSSNLVFRYKIGRTSWDGRPGDTALVRVYPGNKCFRNLRDSNQNGKFLKVFVRNQPVKPTIYDPVLGTEIIGQYTDDRWETYKELMSLDYPSQDEYNSPHRVLMCNEIAGQTDKWLRANQSYGLFIRGETIRSSTGSAWMVVDYEAKRPKLTVDIDQASIYSDSTTMVLSVAPGSHNEFRNADFKLGLYGRNECSGKDPETGIELTGDTAIFYFKVIDTLTVDTIISKVMAYSKWDTLCEGTEIDFASQYKSQYVKWGSDDEKSNPAIVETDRVDYEWAFPEGWIYDPAQPNNDSSSEVPSMIVGHGSGPVKLRFINRCSFDANPKFREKKVVVHPFVRVDIVGDTTPCQADSVVYKFKKAEGADAYQWTFPADWQVIMPEDGSNISDQSSADEKDSISISVRVGHQAGNVYVVGQKTNAPGVYDVYGNLRTDACDFRFDNYQGHNRDSLGIRVKPWTSKPVVDGEFPVLGRTLDTLCAETPYTFQVKKGADIDDSVFFRWIFPVGSGWTEDYYSKNSDTVDFTTAIFNPENSILDPHNKTIRVVSSRYDCDATNIGDTLDIPLWFTDTVSVEGEFYDANPTNNYTKDRLVNPEPCEGDTVYYTLRKQRYNKEAYYATFSLLALDGGAGIAVMAEGDEAGEGTGDGDGDGDGGEDGGDGAEKVELDPVLVANGWQMLSEAPYHDTVKMVVGRVPMLLRAAMVSHCDTSSFKEDTIRPIRKITAAGQIEANRPDANLCEYEAVDFTFKTVEYATHYVFHYPWDNNLPDTLKVADAEADREAGRLLADGRYKISFADTFAYQSGPVYLEAYNVCDSRHQVRAKNDTLAIVSVLTPPAVPVLAKTTFNDPFVYDAFHIISTVSTDTVLDTVCLRKPMVLEAAPNAAESADRPYHYAWSLTQDDASVTSGNVETDGSQWSLTKDTSEPKINYVWLTSRHETCRRFGDTLTVALRNIDTTALQGKHAIGEYLLENSQKEGQGVSIQTRPCAEGGGDVDYYLDLKQLDITGERYYFRWRRDSAQPYGNVYADGDQTLAGGKFILKNAPADNDWTKLDTLKITLPTDADTLEIQVVVINRCGEEAHMPGLRIMTSDAIGNEKYAVVQVSDNICDEEELTFKVVTLIESGTDEGGNPKYDTVDGIAKAGKYIWNAPWHSAPDTVGTFTMDYDTAYQAGSVSVTPYNGCGNGHVSEAVTIIPNDILQPPMRVQPIPVMAQSLPAIDFAAGYDPAGTPIESLSDSLCLRERFEMAVTAALTPEVDAPATEEAATRDALSFGWFPVYGKAEALTVFQDDSSKAYVTVPDFADSAYIIYVAARRSVCQRYGDSLRIALFPMDTIRFINDLVEDTLPYDKFTVLTRGAIRDIRPTPVLDTVSASPCVESALTYAIKPDFHWSLAPDYTSTFSWNGGATGAQATGILDGTKAWLCDDVDQLPAVISIGRVGDASDVLNLSVHAKNICGTSVSKPLPIRPQALIDEAVVPQTPYLEGALCEGDSIRVKVTPVENATGYIWTPSWISQPVTTDRPEWAYPNYRQSSGTITVKGFNACSVGKESEALDLKPLLHIPQQPEAQWFNNLNSVADTVYDTLCLHGNNLLWVKAALDDEAEDGLFYKWELLEDYTQFANLTALPGQSLASGPDSVYVTPINGEMSVGDNLYLMVSARRVSCRYWSKPLYIALHMTDIVPVSDLGKLIWYDDDGNPMEAAPSEPLCPGSEVRIGVEHNAAPAYRWEFPDPTWRVADGNPTGPVVTVVVGERAGVIRVSPMTDPDNRRCTSVASTNVLASDPITLKPALTKPEFINFNEAPCAGTARSYTIEQKADERDRVARYRWEFPQGWRVYDATDNLTDTNVLELKRETLNVLPDSSAGVIKVYTLSLCDAEKNHFSVSQPSEMAVQPQDTARLAIIADETVCKDSTLWMEIKALNQWTFGTGYGLTVAYIGSDAAVIPNPENPLTFEFPDAPDSSFVKVGWHSGDSTRVTFTPRHTGGCHVLPVTYALKADTVPTINGRIIAPERICMGAEAVFTAQTDDIPDGVEVTYYWEVPEDEGWEIVSGAGSAQVVLKAGWYEVKDEEEELSTVIRCYPRAFCGTAAAFEYAITVKMPKPFNGELQAFYADASTPLASDARPCIGSDLAFELTHNDAPADVRYVWEMPDGWNRLSVTGTVADSLLRAAFTAAKAGEDTVRVRFLDLTDSKSCGLSQPVGYGIAIRDSAPAARLTRPPYPCKTRFEVEFVLEPDTEIETVEWTWPEAYNPPLSEVSTTEGSLIKDNKLTVKELTPGEGFTETFGLSIRTANVCGHRDTAITVRPVDKIPNLPDDILHVSHYCLADSGYAYADKLADYVGTGSEYLWLTDAFVSPLKDSLVHENDDPADAETVAWLWFQGASDAADTAQIRFYIQNDCNSTDTVAVRTAPYTYAILARPEADTVVYGRSGVALTVDSVQYGTLNDYTYVWYPEDRVSLSDPAAPDAPGITFATKGLYNPLEYFRVVATERIDTAVPFYVGRSACEAYDTVMIFVDSTFSMVMGDTDTACVDASFEISAHPYGGNSERYHFDWYRLGDDSVYAPIADAGHGETLSMTADAPVIKLMVVGRDSTLVYADAETSDELLYVFSKIDTQYVEVQSFNIEARLIQPGREEIHVPFGTKVRLMAETTEGSNQYAYLWTPVEMLDRYDSTMATVTTLRLYDDCAVTMTVRDLMTHCLDTLQVNIKMSGEMGDIPNAFSPNGDGINDIFMPGADVIIFNRFGQELFRSSEKQEGWDGTYKGTPVSPGEYLYVVTIRKNGNEYVKKGTVTVFTK